MVMKHIIFLVFGIALVFGCSTDDSSNTNEQEQELPKVTRILLDVPEDDSGYASETQLFYSNQGRLDSTLTICPSCTFFHVGPTNYMYENNRLDNVIVWGQSRFELIYEGDNIAQKNGYNDDGELVQVFAYTYDSNDNITKVVEDQINTNFSTETFYEFDDQGNIIRSYSEGSPYYRTYAYFDTPSPYSLFLGENYLKTFSYFPKNNLAKETLWLNDEIDSETTYEYEYNEQGYPTKEIATYSPGFTRTDEFFYE